MFSLKTAVKCHCCETMIDCQNEEKPLHPILTEMDKIRYLCDECNEIYNDMEANDHLLWGFESVEEFIRFVRKAQERGK